MQALTEQTQDHLTSFSKIVKAWRAVRKYSQLALACDAGISQRHLSFLESGRAKPSRDMVINLSEALDIPLRDRNLMLGAAGFAPLYKQRALNDEEMQPVYEALHRSITHHEPYPAIVIDGDWNLLLANDATHSLIELLGDSEKIWADVDPSGLKNIYRLTFHPKGLRSLISNWNILAPQMLTRLQKEANEDHALSILLADVIVMSKEDEGYLKPHVNTPLMPILPMEIALNGMRLNLFSMISTFGTAVDITASELKIESFFPADAQTEQVFKAINGKASSGAGF